MEGSGCDCIPNVVGSARSYTAAIIFSAVSTKSCCRDFRALPDRRSRASCCGGSAGQRQRRHTPRGKHHVRFITHGSVANPRRQINHPAVSNSGQAGLLHKAEESASRKRGGYNQDEQAEPNKKKKRSTAALSPAEQHSDAEGGSSAAIRPDRVVESSTSPREEGPKDGEGGTHSTVVLQIIDSDGSHKGELKQVGVWGTKRVDSILQKPVKRPVQLRKGRTFTRDHLNGICENGVRIVSCMIQASGEAMQQPCTYCEKKNQGPFEQCIMVDDDLFRRCGNCEWVRGRCHGASTTSETSVDPPMDDELDSDLREAECHDKPSAAQARLGTPILRGHGTSNFTLDSKPFQLPPTPSGTSDWPCWEIHQIKTRRFASVDSPARLRCWLAVGRRLTYALCSSLEWKPAKHAHDFDVELEDIAIVRASAQAWRVHLNMKEHVAAWPREPSARDVMVTFDDRETTNRFLEFCVIEQIPISYQEP